MNVFIYQDARTYRSRGAQVPLRHVFILGHAPGQTQTSQGEEAFKPLAQESAQVQVRGGTGALL